MSHPPYSPYLAPNDFFWCPHIKKKYPVNDFRHQKILLKRSKRMFWRCLNRSVKQIQMMVVHQNILSAVMLKNYKLSNGNVRLHLETPEICQTRNSSINARYTLETANLIICFQKFLHYKLSKTLDPHYYHQLFQDDINIVTLAYLEKLWLEIHF